MGNQQFHRVVIRHEVKLVYGCFLRGAQLRREDIIVQMLCQKDSCPDVLHLELLQQCFQLWELHLPDRDILHCFGKLVEGFYLHGQVGKYGCVGDDAIIVKHNGIFPLQRTQPLLRILQFFLRGGKLQRHRALIANVGMQSKRESEEVFRLFRQFLWAGWHGC